jgi:Subtilase family
MPLNRGGNVPVQKSWEDRLVARIADQVQTIKEQFQARRKLTIVDVPDPDGGVAYMYVEGQLLVRDKYVEEVSRIFNQPKDPQQGQPSDPKDPKDPKDPEQGQPSDSERGQPSDPKDPKDPEPVQRIAPGVSLLIQDPKISPHDRRTVYDTLDIIDRQLGTGIATPNHVFTVAPSGPCPATEPEEVYYGIEPYPSVCLGNSGAGVLIYVADTGLLQAADVDHPWLNGVTRALHPNGTVQDWDPAGTALTNTVTDAIPPYAGHGTFVAGVIRCMAPEADVIVSNVFYVAGSTLESDLGAELDQALGLGVDIFHLSITATTRKELAPLGFYGFLRRLRQHQGVVCVAAAGNNGNRKPCWPAAFPEMVSVGALGADWRGRATFSNYGHWVRVYAPGRDLINAYATGTYTCQDFPYQTDVRKFYGMAKWSGTSFSTPIVTGLVAARMSRTGETGKEAAAALLAEARANAIPGVGPVLLPCGDQCDKPPRRPCCRDAGRCGHDAGC